MPMRRHLPSAADVGRGAIIAAQGVPPRVPACAQCHAFSGGSDGSGAFPRIAGQSLYYLDQQMRDFASGVRVNAVMTPIAKGLSAGEILDVTAYYASVASPFLPLASGDPNLVKRGEQLAKSATHRGMFNPVTIVTDRTVPASHRQSRTWPGNTLITSPLS